MVIKGLLGEGMKTSLQDIHTILIKIKPQQRPRHDRGGVGGVKNFSLLGLLVGLPAPSPSPYLLSSEPRSKTRSHGP